MCVGFEACWCLMNVHVAVWVEIIFTSYLILPVSFNMISKLLVFTLHTLVVARSGKPRASFVVIKNNLLLTDYAYNLNTLQKTIDSTFKFFSVIKQC